MGPARIYSFPDFDEYALRQRWTDQQLIKVVEDVESGLNDGDLGSSVFKRRVARKGAGSAAGYRVVVVLRPGERAFLIEAFAKNIKEKHRPQEVRALRQLADELLGMSDQALALALQSGELREIKRKDVAVADEETY